MKKSILTHSVLLTIIVIIAGLYSCTGKKDFPFNNPELSVDERVEDLVSSSTTSSRQSVIGYRDLL